MTAAAGVDISVPLAGSHGQAGSAEQRVQGAGQGGAPGHRGGHQGQVILLGQY